MVSKISVDPLCIPGNQAWYLVDTLFTPQTTWGGHDRATSAARCQRLHVRALVTHACIHTRSSSSPMHAYTRARHPCMHTCATTPRQHLLKVDGHSWAHACVCHVCAHGNSGLVWAAQCLTSLPASNSSACMHRLSPHLHHYMIDHYIKHRFNGCGEQ